MKKKNILTSILQCHLLFSISTTAYAQNDTIRSRSVFLEFGGGSNGVGINYDARFKEDSKWGYRVGFAFGYSQANYFFAAGTSTRVYSIPLEVNYLLGKGKNRLEMGLGVNTGYYNDHIAVAEHFKFEAEQWRIAYKNISENNISSFAYLNIGYRYTHKRGFQFRIGITPACMITNNRYCGREALLGLYIGFGKAF